LGQERFPDKYGLGGTDQVFLGSVICSRTLTAEKGKRGGGAFSFLGRKQEGQKEEKTIKRG